MHSYPFLVANQLEIKDFRRFKNVLIELGTDITVVSGQNGVGKSSLLSLIASASGISRSSILGTNFQPEFKDFFYIDEKEKYENYSLHLTFNDEFGNLALKKRLGFKNDIKSGRGIRVIPRLAKTSETSILQDEKERIKSKYGIGADGRIKKPTIYLSLSRLYPLGETTSNAKIKKVPTKNKLYQQNANMKFKEWYNAVINNSIKNEESLTIIDKNVGSRPSLYMHVQDIPTLCQSVGQDNLANIISSLVDIYMLSLQEGYAGAVLCIDEVDVSLHPDTQIKLFTLLVDLSRKLRIQIFLSSHSLIIIKEILKKQKNDSVKYRLVYLKNPSSPYVSTLCDYYSLRADLFEKISFYRPSVNIYFEDDVGIVLFKLFFRAYQYIYNVITSDDGDSRIRNLTSCTRDTLYDKIKRIGNVDTFVFDNCKALNLGCEVLISVNKQISYFKKTVIVLDGDAKIKETKYKPKISDFLNIDFTLGEGISCRKDFGGPNLIFLPGFFAPESFLYRILRNVIDNQISNMEFWRGLDECEDTSMYTPDRINNIFNGLGNSFSNDDLKRIFNDTNNGVWAFIERSDIVSYYYCDCDKMGELLKFIKSFKEAYQVASSELRKGDLGVY